MPYKCATPEKFIGHVLYGSGQCVEFVRAVTASPQAPLWTKGTVVKGNASIASGTAIATFNKEGKYASLSTGNHAAIYLSQDDGGIFVVEQYKGLETVQKRHIAFRGGHGSPSNDGDAYSVIE